MAMLALAIVPGPSVIAVVARTLSAGLSHGLLMTVGLVAGDFVLILLATQGLAIATAQLTDLFSLVKYLGSAYLLWLSLQLFLNQPQTIQLEARPKTALLSDFFGGLSITLSDPKALLFYISFLPAYLDLSHLSWRDMAGLMGAATLAVGGSKVAYVYAAHRVRHFFTHMRLRQWLNRLAGGVMLMTAILLLLKG
ncbi:MAG: LysE family translocator [Cyanobacteria bacterium P01_A01_bin.105]